MDELLDPVVLQDVSDNLENKGFVLIIFGDVIILNVLVDFFADLITNFQEGKSFDVLLMESNEFRCQDKGFGQS